jgi:DNA polymerase-3 subunit gamma/tau
MLASLLEKGSPLQVSEGALEIGFAKGSFEYSRAQEKEVQDDIAQLAARFFGRSVSFRAVVLTDSAGQVPISLAEKKSREEARQRAELKEVAEGHPLVKAALEIFGGTLDGHEQLKQ